MMQPRVQEPAEFAKPLSTSLPQWTRLGRRARAAAHPGSDIGKTRPGIHEGARSSTCGVRGVSITFLTPPPCHPGTSPPLQAPNAREEGAPPGHSWSHPRGPLDVCASRARLGGAVPALQREQRGCGERTAACRWPSIRRGRVVQCVGWIPAAHACCVVYAAFAP
jgi:hypothetical protein